MNPAPDSSSYTWGLAMIDMALLVALFGALANRVEVPHGSAAHAAVISDPMGFAMPEAQSLADCESNSRFSPASVASIPTD